MPRVVFDQATTGTYAGAMSGSGSLAKQNTGTLILTGANTYSGGTTVSGGTLQGNTTSLQGDIVNNASVVFDQATTGTYAGVMSGSGGLTKQGADTLTLSGVNSYSGGTTINGGTLAVSSDANLGAAGTNLTFDGGTLQLLAAGSTSRTVTLNAAGGTIDTNGLTYQMQSTITGTGGLTKTGAGTLVLFGSSNYSGGTTVSAGTLQGNTSTLRGDIVNNASVVFNSTTNGTYAGALSGTGSLTVMNNAGAGLILTGTNSYSGGTTIGGTVSVSSDANLGAASGGLAIDLGTLRSLASFASTRDITLGVQGGTFDTNGFTSTQNGAITGAGRLTKTGSGTLILTGNNSYSGGTTVSAGTLSGTTTSLQGNIVNNAQLVFDQSTLGTYAGVISGTGSLVKDGGGTVILTGANSYSGSTTINDGTLQGDTTSLHGNITDNGILVFDQLAADSYSGVISGTGSLTKQGAGTLILTGTNRYSGGTTVSAGTLQGSVTGLQGNIVNNAAVVFDQGSSFGNYRGDMSGSGSLTLASGSVFLAGTSSYTGGTTIDSGAILSGTTASLQASIVNNGIVGFEQASDGTFAGAISGTGGLYKLGTGTVTLAGNNSYAGGTSIDGGALAVSSNSNLGDVSGGLFFYGGTLKFLTNFDSDRTIGLGAGGIGIIGLPPLPASGTFDTNGHDLTLSGVISGPYGLIKAGAGTLTLSAANTYAGGTTVNAGTLKLGAGGSLAATGALAVNGGTFDLDGHNQTVGALSGSGGAILLGSGTLSAGGAGNTTLATSISGSGGFVKQGSGGLILTGANSYSGGTTVSAGVLQGNTQSLQGNILNNAVVTFDQATTGTYAGVLSGSGMLVKANAGTLTLGGVNSYSGGTLVLGGVLQGTTATLQGNILNNASVVFAGGGTYAGAMSGTGSLATGGGTLILSGANSYTGGTLVAGGVLQGTASSLQGNIVNNAAVVFSQSGAGTYAGNMSGSGSLVVQGGGALVLAGINSYTGGTTVSGGVLQGNAQSLQGNITNNASVVFNQTGTATYAGIMSGSGSMTLQGGGTLDLQRQPYLHRLDHGRCQQAGRQRQPRQRRHPDQRRHAGRQRLDRRPCLERRHAGAGQLDRHAQHQRQLHAEWQRLPGRDQCRGPERSHQCRRHRHHPGRQHGAGAGPARRLCAQHHLHDPQCHRRRLGHLLRRDQQLRLPDAVAELRCRQCVPDPGDDAERLCVGGADGQPVRRRHRARPDEQHRHRRLQQRAQRHRHAQRAAGPAGASTPSAASPTPTSAR